MVFLVKFDIITIISKGGIMAGAFGGDDDIYNDEENIEANADDLENEQVNEIVYEEEDEEDEDLEEEEEELEEETEQLSRQELNRLRKAEKKSVENRLQRIRLRAPYRFWPHFTIQERAFLRKARKQHPKQVARIFALMAARKEVFRAKIKSIIGPALPIVLIVLAILLIILVFAAVIDSIFGGGSSGEDGASTQFGVSGEDFYGCRVVYTDEEQAQIEIIENYIEVLKGSIESIEMQSLDITIELPADDYNFDEFNEVDFSSNYTEAYAVLNLMVDEVYNYDNDSTGDSGTGLNLMQKIDGIEYFGFDTNLLNNLSSLIAGYINDNDLYAIDGEDAGVEDQNTEQTITSGISSYFAGVSGVRTEKLFMKDFIFENSSDMMRGIGEENYIALIFMPKNQVQFNYFSFLIDSTDFSNFNMYIQSGEQTINLSSSEFTSAEDGENPIYLYESASNLNVTAETYQNISTSNLSYLASEMSLIDIVNGELDYNIYLTTNSSQDGTTYLTWKEDGVIAYFESGVPFTFVEWETQWN